jgi:threonine dehydrogenase-like Zn-dependent dehydrogenase
MKAIVVTPGTASSVRLADVPMPSLADVPNGRGVLVKILRVGVDATDKEINAAEYGAAPAGDSHLVLGHESFGRVVAVGDAVTELRAGDYVVISVRRPGTSIYDQIGAEDMTTDDVYYERGISHLHGFLTEYVVDDARYMVKLPPSLREVGVLLEPMTVVEKGIAQAYEIQRRLRVWQPKRAAVIGAGTIGLLATLLLRLRGIEVTTLALARKPNRNAALIEQLDAAYVSVMDESIRAASMSHGPFDLIIEASGYSPAAFESMEAVAKNGVLVLISVTGGMRNAEVPTDRINLGFVLGNKVMVGSVNANHEHFEAGVRDLLHAEAQFPGWLGQLFTNRVRGLENYAELFEILEHGSGVIKVFCDVAAEAETGEPVMTPAGAMAAVGSG